MIESDEQEGGHMVFFGLLVLMLSLVFYQSFLNGQNERIVKSNFVAGQATVVHYINRDLGASGTGRIVKYLYRVGKKDYSREIITARERRIISCDDELMSEECKSKKFWVIYSREYPERSLINLKVEIQNIDNPKFPENLDDFE